MKIYRPCEFAFPASRGRSGFVMKEDGTIGLIGPSPIDGIDTTWGTWVQIGPGMLKLSFGSTKISRLHWTDLQSKRVVISMN